MKIETNGQAYNKSGSLTRFYRYRGLSFCIREKGRGSSKYDDRGCFINNFKRGVGYIYRISCGPGQFAKTLAEARLLCKAAIDKRRDV